VDSYIIRRLDPIKDRECFEEAYSWRTVKRLSRMIEGVIDLEDFLNPNPNEVVLGMFNRKLESVFLIEDHGKGTFQVHFTNRPGLSKDDLAKGALTIKNKLFEYGAREIFGYLRERHSQPNHPVRRFAESIGFFLAQQCSNYVIMRGEQWVWWRKFVARR